MIYIVEDEDNVREMVCYALRQSGFHIVGFESAERFWEGMAQAVPSLVLLDIMLPDETGLSVLMKLKEAAKTAHLPVIMLTAMGTEYDRIKGLDAGADDYIAKPFSVMELIARVRALLRRAERDSVKTSEKDEITLGNLTLNYNKRSVHAQGKEITLTLKEFEMLHLLLSQKDMVLTREQLLTTIWGYEYEGISNRTVDVHVGTLRRKLGPCGDMIKTLRGVGYKISWAG
jgi:two-component system alkaline phosphatase synthesis response regulator PhoP